MAFQYDNIVTLIELVEARPCLWDKTNDLIKNKILREKCWRDSEMSKAEKNQTGEIITKKWSNVRDSFIKSIRTTTGQGYKKKYIYAEHLSFLLKIAEKAITDSNLSSASNTPELPAFSPEPIQSTSEPLAVSPEPPASTPEPPASTPEPSASTSRPSQSTQPASRSRQKKKAREPDAIEREILGELKKRARNDTNIIPAAARDEKETMLLSFLPYVKDMNETELMDLHIEILNSVRKIKQKRALNHPIYTRTSSLSFSDNDIESSQLSSASPATIKPQSNVRLTNINLRQAMNEVNETNLPPEVDENKPPATDINSQQNQTNYINQALFSPGKKRYHTLINVNFNSDDE